MRFAIIIWWMSRSRAPVEKFVTMGRGRGHETPP